MPRPEVTPAERIAAAQAALISAIRDAHGWSNQRALYWLRDHVTALCSPIDPKTRLP